MIIEEYTDNTHRMIKRYSDRKVKIQNEQTLDIYTVAINLADSDYTYKETNIPISNLDNIELKQEINNLTLQMLELKNNNDMLLECLLEMSELVYE